MIEKEKDIECIVNKVLISDLTKTKYQKRVFLTIENNKTQILETGTEVDFIDVSNYIQENKNEKNKLEMLNKYFEDNDVLLVGIKMNRTERYNL